MERHILQSLHWELHIVTSYDILQHFLAQGIIFSSDSIISYRESRQTPNAHIAKTSHSYADFYLEMCVQDYSFM